MKNLLVALTFLVLLGTALAGQENPASRPNVLPRVIVAISDLHLGAGEIRTGEYLPQEDFRWGEDFITFLDGIHRAGGGKVTLVIAGDMFEMWEAQAGQADCNAVQEFGCSQDEALTRMNRIVSAHRLELQALGAFASRGTNQVIIVPGNHDAALVFPRVWDLVKTAARPSRPEHFKLATEGRWIFPAGNIVVEHGHQFDDANRFDVWPDPVRETASGRRLQSPFGEALVREFFDPIERKHAVVDNITGGAGLLYGVKREGLVGSARVFTDFLRLLSLDTSWRQLFDFLGESQVPVWDVAATRSSPVSFLASSFPVDDATTPLIRELLDASNQDLAAAAQQTVAGMSEKDIETICQSRYAVYLEAEEQGIPVDQRPSRCPQVSGDLGYLKGKAVQKVRGSLYYVNQYVDGVVESQVPFVPDKPRIFVYGHTHAATRAMHRSRQGQGKPDVIVINTGAWQRLVAADTVVAKAKEKRWASNEVIDKLEMNDLPACYSFVWIPYQLGKVGEPVLRYWGFKEDRWQFTSDCEEREILLPEQ